MKIHTAKNSFITTIFRQEVDDSKYTNELLGLSFFYLFELKYKARLVIGLVDNLPMAQALTMALAL